jgi:hypothetical protein
MSFNWSILTDQDYKLARQILGRDFREPDLTISPDGTPYLHRWHVIPRNPHANEYLHVQVASDPERPLHDHPWDNQSVILSGGYIEITQPYPPSCRVGEYHRHKGQVIQREASEAHRLILPKHVPYTMTLFSTGPTIRGWGYWVRDDSLPEGKRWLSHAEANVIAPDGSSLYVGPKE